MIYTKDIYNILFCKLCLFINNLYTYMALTYNEMANTTCSEIGQLFTMILMNA